ncbi:hypothetical protein L6R53_10560 [Myxococcota bacterium]|nr:hypothetical protein [Myxococcota bacterium]
MTKKQTADRQVRLDRAFSQESFDQAFLAALRKVAQEPMPPEPKTIYDLRPNAVGGRVRD